MRLSEWQLALMKAHLSDSGGREVRSSHKVGRCSLLLLVIGLVVVGVAVMERQRRAVAKRIVVKARWPLNIDMPSSCFASGYQWRLRLCFAQIKGSQVGVNRSMNSPWLANRNQIHGTVQCRRLPMIIIVHVCTFNVL